MGAGKSLKSGIPDEELEGVYFGLDFLREVNTGKEVKIGKKAAIIGGGNTAVEAARTARRLGADEVSILYRRTREEMPAHREDVAEAESEGVRINYLTAPVRVLGKNDEADGIECIRTELAETDESGRRIPVPVRGSEFVFDADTVVVAIGESPELSALTGEGKLGITPEGALQVDEVSLNTGLPGIFAGGDAVSGPSSVVEAIASGKKAATSIDRYLRGEDLEVEREIPVKKVAKPPKEGIETEARQAAPLLPVEQRIRSFREVKTGFTEEMAMEEAQRCMTCGSKAYIAYFENCMVCYNCELECPSKAVNVDPFRKFIPPLIAYP